MFLFTALCSCLKPMILKSEERSFVNFMRENSVYYTGDEYSLRLGIFITNLRRVQEFNRDQSQLFRVGINQFSAYTPTEISSLLKGAKGERSPPTNSPNLKKADPSISKNKLLGEQDTPDEFDWRTKEKVVGEIKEQGQCGSCWAFSTISVQESRWAIVKNKAYVLSEQELIDCCTACYGCYGGIPWKTIDYVIAHQNGHFDQNYLYPNRYQMETCKYDPQHDVSLVTGYVQIIHGSEEDLAKQIVLLGPASVVIDSSPWSFVYYTGGIYADEKCSVTFYDHAVTIVGFGADENKTHFWILRNSWGLKWGEQGYMRILKDHGDLCGVAVAPIIPTVE